MFSVSRVASLSAALILCFAQGAGAQGIVKQIDRNGHIIYTDNPDPGARILARYAPLATPNAEQPVQAATLMINAREESDIERALAEMTPILSARAAVIDSIEAILRTRREQLQAVGRSTPPALTIVYPDVPARSETKVGMKTIWADEHQNMPKFIFSAVCYLVFALGLGFMAFLSLRVLLSGLASLFKGIDDYWTKLRTLS